MTDAGYVAGGYGVTVAAIGAYVGHMWARTRTVARLVKTQAHDAPPAGAGTAEGPSGPLNGRQGHP